MRRPWTRRSEHSDLEKRLRDERPRPDEELVRSVSRESSRPGAMVPRFRLGMATAVTGIVLAAVVALGGLGSPIDTVTGIAQFDNAKNQGQNEGKNEGKNKGKNEGKNEHGEHGDDDDNPADDEYEEKVTICHRPPGNPSNAQTLTLSRSGAQNHLRNHPGDTAGPCPPRR